MLTDYGKQRIMLRIGSDVGSPSYMAIGTGSGAVNLQNTGLVTHFTRINPTSTNWNVSKEVTYTGDYSTVTMSGASVREYGMFAESSGGKIWNREGFNAIAFDGTNELQLEITYQVF